MSDVVVVLLVGALVVNGGLLYLTYRAVSGLLKALETFVRSLSDE